VSYAALTRQDANPVKRWLQERRLQAAVDLVEPERAQRIVDYGAADGEVCARLAERWPEADILCFEPAPHLRHEAANRLSGRPVRLVEDEAGLPTGWAQTVLCLEVLEHLPPDETERALDTLHRVLEPGGVLICGVPVEIGPAAVAKGLFRRVRRKDEFDAQPKHIAAAALGRPPAERPVQEFAPGRAYHPHHLGFDHRRLLRDLRARFRVARTVGSPFGGALPIANAELYIVAVKERP
jgi:trans-aconitate methyltransferase